MRPIATIYIQQSKHVNMDRKAKSKAKKREQAKRRELSSCLNEPISGHRKKSGFNSDCTIIHSEPTSTKRRTVIPPPVPVVATMTTRVNLFSNQVIAVVTFKSTLAFIIIFVAAID